MVRKKAKDISYEIGDILEVQSFAGPKVYQRVVELVSRTTKFTNKDLGTISVKGFWGVFTRRGDIAAMRKACVPYTGKEAPSKCRSFTYDWSILRVIKKQGAIR